MSLIPKPKRRIKEPQDNVQRFKYGLCTEGRQLTQQGHCERNMTAVHSGLMFRCTSCSTVFERGDQKHGCVGGHLFVTSKVTLRKHQIKLLD
uniref:Uncharacterized protein n=1 Tax=Magallana gigas TaxID=29159 RepID=A0A8W8JJB9_MAGGI